MKVLFAALWLGLATTVASLAVEPGERLADPALEARARTLGSELRCLVCQNQSIDDSNADLAHDLRLLIRERLAAGDSDGQVLNYLVRRYGDFILLKPPLKPATYALWLGPFAILLIAATVILVRLHRRAGAARQRETPLSAEEQRRLAKLLAEEGG